MRNESTIYTLLIQWAERDDNIRAMVVNGSRGDPTRTPDALSDYDVAVFVRDLELIRDDEWLARFGDVMVRWPLKPESTLGPDWITQLVLFSDGVRIDFQFTGPQMRDIEVAADYHCVLIDKDRLSESLTGIPIEGSTIILPTAAEFAERVNAFWWDIPYVAKALKRREIDYARFVMESDLRFNKLHPLIRWHIGLTCGVRTDLGIFGRWFSRYLDDTTWRAYLETYSGSDVEDQWRAMFAMTRFVRMLGADIALRVDCLYPRRTDEDVSAHLRQIRDDPEA
jgi:aminoglycoside 6-adenylyltransferase